MTCAVGANLGWDGSGVPTHSALFGLRGHPHAASDLATPGTRVKNFRVVSSLGVGDLALFHASDDHGHCTVWLGGGLLIYAGRDAVKLGLLPDVMLGHDRLVYRKYRQ
jgi:hypothetical protein